MFIENFEFALSKLSKNYKKEKTRNNKISLLVDKTVIDDFEIRMEIVFESSQIASVVISENRFLKNYIKKFIIEKVIETGYDFKILSSTEFLYENFESIKFARNPQITIQFLSSLTEMFFHFMKSVKDEYDSYNFDSNKWIKHNMRGENMSFFEKWDIPTDGSFINLASDKYSKLIDSSQEIKNFDEITMICLPKNKKMKSIIAIMQLDSMYNRVYVRDFESKTKFGEVIRDINKKLMNNC